MLIQPLVENAVMHGLEPKVDGGEIVIRVRENDDYLRVEVLDTGTGMMVNRHLFKEM
jgi:sensor histidine kinase YesM